MHKRQKAWSCRVLLGGLALVAASAAAFAEPFDEYEAAVENFMGGYPSPSDFQFQYAQSVLKNIAGKWVELNRLDGRADPSSPQPLTAGELERVCGLKFASQIKMLDGLSFEIEHAAETDKSVKIRYQAMGGAQFAFTGSPTQAFDRIGFDIDQAFEEERVNWFDLLAGSAGTATIFVPSENVRVIFPDGGQPVIMVRCNS